MPQDLDNLLLNVIDEWSFQVFLEAMAADFAKERHIDATKPNNPYGAGALGWEHNTIDGFLSAAAAVRIDHAMANFGDSENNPWRRCAAILYGAKHYE